MMMKKVISILLVSGVLFSFTGCSIRFEVDHKNNNSSYEEVSNVNKSIQYNNEEKIDIQVNFGEVNISGYDGNEIIVTGRGNGGDKNLKLESNNGKITVKDLSNSKNINFSLFNNNASGMYIDVKVPYSFKGDLYFSYGAGDSTIKDVKCNKLDVEGGAGNLQIDDVVFERFKLDAGVGDSTINLSEKCGEMDIDCGVGNVNIEISDVAGNLILDGGVGNTKIRIPENAPVYFDTDSGIGSTKISAKTSGENTYEFDINGGVGNIEVYN